jgi:hypothetical protein
MPLTSGVKLGRYDSESWEVRKSDRCGLSMVALVGPQEVDRMPVAIKSSPATEGSGRVFSIFTK